jgi:hypothetical protein
MMINNTQCSGDAAMLLHLFYFNGTISGRINKTYIFGGEGAFGVMTNL